jgi:putative membrane protein
MSNVPYRLEEAVLSPRIIEVELRDAVAPLAPPGPQVIATEQSGPIVPTERVRAAAAVEPVRRRDRVVTFGIAGVAVLLAGWAAVDAAAWISGAFERSAVLGVLAAVAVTAGVGGAGAIIAREAVSLMRLRSVEAVRRGFSDAKLASAGTRDAVGQVLAVLPRDRETTRAIAAFQRQVQVHHGRAQQVELLSRGVLKPLDEQAQAHVRTAVVRAFGITAISPTALTDAAFFLACGVRMVRAVAGVYGHRPTAAATLHLLRRLLFEAGKLGAVDLASASLVQHLGGAVTERFATSTAEALYAAYRMARLGIIVMDLCRPLAWESDEVPSVASLVSGVLARRAQTQAAISHDADHARP